MRNNRQMTDKQIQNWKDNYTIAERLVHVRKTATALADARKRRAKALEASMGGPGFVVSSTGRGNSSRRNGAHNTMQKRLNDALQSYRDNLETLKAMVNSLTDYDL